MQFIHSRVIGSAFLILGLNTGVSARQWTNGDGKIIEADYVSANDSEVVLKRAGKEFNYPLDKLSAEDQAYILKQGEKTAAKTGWIHDFPITRPAFAETKGYLTGKTARTTYQAFEKGDFPPTWTTNKKDVKAEFAYDVATAKTHVYVPAGYDGSKPFGVYLHISHSDNGENVAGYAAVMDNLNLIYISPFGVSNNQPMLRRVRLAVDALSSVREIYRVEPERIAIGGISGGGHMAMLTHAMFPEFFMGAVSHAAQSYLPLDGGMGHFPGLSVRDLKSGDLKGHKWCVISGNKDQNYGEILETTKEWKDAGLDYRFFDVSGMGHTNADAAQLEESLKWLGL